MVEPPITFPDDWKTPSAAVQKAIDAAAKEYGIDAEILYGIGRRETGFTVNIVGKANGMNSKAYANSYLKRKDQKIPGSSLTWGDMFPTPESWSAYGFLQINPYNLVGKGLPVKAGAPLAELLKPQNQARAGAKLLVQLYQKADGDWPTAILYYNGSKQYRADVAKNIAALRTANGVA